MLGHEQGFLQRKGVARGSDCTPEDELPTATTGSKHSTGPPQRPRISLSGALGVPSYHSFRRSGVFRMIEAMRAPFRGGLEYMGRMRIFSCDSTLLASSASLQITVKAPARSPERGRGNQVPASALGYPGLGQDLPRSVLQDERRQQKDSGC